MSVGLGGGCGAISFTVDARWEGGIKWEVYLKMAKASGGGSRDGANAGMALGYKSPIRAGV